MCDAKSKSLVKKRHHYVCISKSVDCVPAGGVGDGERRQRGRGGRGETVSFQKLTKESHNAYPSSKTFLNYFRPFSAWLGS